MQPVCLCQVSNMANKGFIKTFQNKLFKNVSDDHLVARTSFTFWAKSIKEIVYLFPHGHGHQGGDREERGWVGVGEGICGINGDEEKKKRKQDLCRREYDSLTKQGEHSEHVWGIPMCQPLWEGLNICYYIQSPPHPRGPFLSWHYGRRYWESQTYNTEIRHIILEQQPMN